MIWSLLYHTRTNMIYFTNCYAKIWKITPADKYADVRISTSEKDKDGNYVNSNWFARCLGKAAKQILEIKEGERIKINKGKVSNELYTDKNGEKKSALRVIIFDLESADTSGGTASYTPAQSAATAASNKDEEAHQQADDDYPF